MAKYLVIFRNVLSSRPPRTGPFIHFRVKVGLRHVMLEVHVS